MGYKTPNIDSIAIQLPHLMTPLIEAFKKIEQPEEGLTALAEAQALVEETGERYYEAELQRLKGELLRSIPRRSGRGRNLLPQRT